MKRIALAAVLLLAAAALAGVARPEGAHAVDGTTPSTDSITVSGSGSVAADADERRLLVRGRRRGPRRPGPRSRRTRARCEQVIAAVKAAGGREVGTQSVSLSQVVRPERRAERVRRLERRLGEGRRRSGRSGDRRCGRCGREPGQRPVDVGRRPGQALPAGAEGRDGRRAAPRRDARCCGGTLARQGDDGRRERRLGAGADVREGRRLGCGTPIEAGTQQTTARCRHLRAG